MSGSRDSLNTTELQRTLFSLLLINLVSLLRTMWSASRRALVEIGQAQRNHSTIELAMLLGELTEPDFPSPIYRPPYTAVVPYSPARAALAFSPSERTQTVSPPALDVD